MERMRQATWWSGRRCIPETINEPATDPRSGHAADQVTQQRAPTRYPEADAQLEANIAEYGVIQNLKGVPVARKKGAFEDEYVLPVLVLADARNAIEISLAENFIRLAMNLADPAARSRTSSRPKTKRRPMSRVALASPRSSSWAVCGSSALPNRSSKHSLPATSRSTWRSLSRQPGGR